MSSGNTELHGLANIKIILTFFCHKVAMSSSNNGETLDEDDENILEGTLALIKPDAVDRAKDIINIIIAEGFLVVEKKKFQFTREVNGHS